MKTSPLMNFQEIELCDVNAVLLDLDDTLYSYKPSHDAAILACFEFYNFGLSFPNYLKQYRAARDSVTRKLKPQGACRSRLFAFLMMAESYEVQQGHQIAYALDEIYWSNFISRMKPDPHALEFLLRCVKEGDRKSVV